MAKQRLRKKPSNDEPYDPLAVPVTGANRLGLWSFRLAIWGLIPGVGLLFGPAALLLGLFARLRGLSDPTFFFIAPTWAGVVLGAIVAVTNWVGLWLMMMGLQLI